jgi:glycosyltransferase involved in cell wall biosynthesis
MLVHKRGVENVIHFQSQGSPFNVNYYLHWGTQTSVSRYDNLICIGIKKDLIWPIKLNIILYKLNKRDRQIFIHSHNPLMSIVSFFQSNLLTVHDALYYLTNSTKHKLKNIFWLLEKLLYLRCNYVHFISNFSKKMSLFSNDDNFIIIPNTSHFENIKSNDLLNKGNLKKNTSGVTKVLTVRSIEERALINMIIEVAEKLKCKDFEFLIAGKGPLLDFYRNKIIELGLNNITLLGYVSDIDLINYYKECDLVLVPAAYGEGFGLPIIEGYLFDKPVLASNVCAIPEIIISNNFLFENTIDSIIGKIESINKHENFYFRNYYNEHYSNKKIVSKMNELYNNLL